MMLTNTERLTVEAILCRAAQTLEAMPTDRPSGHRAFWPDIVRKASESFATDAMRDRLERSARPSPTAKDIDELDDVLTAVLTLTRTERRLVWARALHADWEWIARRMKWIGHKRTVRTWQRQHQRALKKLVAAMSRMSHISGQSVIG